MNNKEYKSILRIFHVPKDWRQRGNMEFDELLAICLSHPQVGKEEVFSRINIWGIEFRITRHVLTTLIVIISLPVITFFFISNPVVEILMVIITCSIGVAIYRVMKRKKSIQDKLENLYGWLLLEVPYPTSRLPEFMEHAFLRSTDRLIKEDWKATRKMARTIAIYGNYSLTTLNN